MCEIACVSRSGYYAWLNNEERRNEREKQDRADFDVILAAYQHRGYDKGSRGIYMRLLQTGIIMNRKKIQRLMTKYQLRCPIRKPNPYKQWAKAKQEQLTKPNHLNRQFKAHGPKTVLLTDITYLPYGKGQKAYLVTVKDAFTNQILSYAVSPSFEVDFVLDCLLQLFTHHAIPKNQRTLIHSDQGAHYTSLKFQSLVNSKGLRQSMSRRGNCWDNAPQESFFGHMKDDIKAMSGIHTFTELKAVLDDYMDYYNNERYQWGLAKLSPNQYERFVKTGVYPLRHLLNTPELPVVSGRDESVL